VSRNGAHGDWRIRAQAVDRWRQTHGDLCPGWQRPAHVADPPGGHNPLSADHPLPRSRGGPLYLPVEAYAILCRACNASKGNRLAPPPPPPPSRRSRVW
jgi:5-methylcytosine-specific restriction enzyme A